MERVLMTGEVDQFQAPVFDQGIIIIVGGFGSGKSEIAVNLARHFAKTGNSPVAIADLDIVNPYFRSREASEELTALGVRSLVPPGDQAYADLPIILPEIKGAIRQNEGKLILDVGGDDLGARILLSLGDAFLPGDYDLLLVLNRNRPFTSDIKGTLKTIEEIEGASGLKLTGIISNTHLLEETTAGTVLDGLDLSQKVAMKTGLPVRFVCAVTDIAKMLNPADMSVPLLSLDRSLLKPWERRRPTGPNLT